MINSAQYEGIYSAHSISLYYLQFLSLPVWNDYLIPLYLQSHNNYIHDTISLIHPLCLQVTYHNLWAAWLPWQQSTSALLTAAIQLFDSGSNCLNSSNRFNK